MHTCTIWTIPLKGEAGFTPAHKATRYIVTELTAIMFASFTFVNVYTGNNGYMEEVQLISNKDKNNWRKLLLINNCLI